MFRLRTESYDDEPHERDFETAPEAIDYAVRWFLEGYANDSIDNDGRARARADVPRLRATLEAGQEFTCDKFNERISVIPSPES